MLRSTRSALIIGRCSREVWKLELEGGRRGDDLRRNCRRRRTRKRQRSYRTNSYCLVIISLALIFQFKNPRTIRAYQGAMLIGRVVVGLGVGLSDWLLLILKRWRALLLIKVLMRGVYIPFSLPPHTPFFWFFSPHPLCSIWLELNNDR